MVFRKIPILFILMVLVPTALAYYYYYYKASPQYVAEAQFVIQGNNVPKLDVLGALTGMPSMGGGASDALVIRNYLQSGDFLKDISKVVDLKSVYSKSSIDAYARLDPNASQEDVLEYWQNMIEIEHDQLSGISLIRMVAFDRETSRELVKLALSQSENLINHMSNRLRNDSLAQAEKEAKAAETALTDIRNKITQFRQKQDVLDPVKQEGERIGQEESTRLALVSQLQTQLAQAEAELAQLNTFMQPEALKVKNLQSKVNALRNQIAKEQSITKKQTTGKSAQVATNLSKFTELQSQQAFAEQLYQAKVASLEQAKIEHNRQQRYLTVIVQPNLPDEALRPDKLTGVLTVLLLSFLAWGIGSLSIAAIRDHAGWV